MVSRCVPYSMCLNPLPPPYSLRGTSPPFRFLTYSHSPFLSNWFTIFTRFLCDFRTASDTFPHIIRVWQGIHTIIFHLYRLLCVRCMFQPYILSDLFSFFLSSFLYFFFFWLVCLQHAPQLVFYLLPFGPCNCHVYYGNNVLQQIEAKEKHANGNWKRKKKPAKKSHISFVLGEISSE